MQTLLFLLLDAAPDKNAKIAELIAPILSGLAFILSAAAFIFTVLIQTKERRRNIRQTLSTALSDLARINVETSLLKKDEKESTPEIVRIRKNYNSQRGTLVSGADFLMNENHKIITDADCELMAMTYDDIGDTQKAGKYWLLAIRHARTPTQTHLHQRDYAAFLFDNNREEDGRRYFKKSMDADIHNTDDNLRCLADTCLIWAGLEKNFGNTKVFHQLIAEARDTCANIKHRTKKLEMQKLIDLADKK